MSRVRENRTHGSMGRGWKRATCYWHVEMGAVGKPFGMSATAYGSYRASLLPDPFRKADVAAFSGYGAPFKPLVMSGSGACAESPRGIGVRCCSRTPLPRPSTPPLSWPSPGRAKQG